MYTLSNAYDPTEPQENKTNFDIAERGYSTNAYPYTANTIQRRLLKYVGNEPDPIYGIPRRVFVNQNGMKTYDHDLLGTLQPDTYQSTNN